MAKVWLDITEAAFKTGESEDIMQEFIEQNKHNENIIKKDNERVLINSSFLEQEYSFLADYAGEQNDKQMQEEQANLIANKQILDIAQHIINRPFYKTFTFWLSVFFVILILILFTFGYLYRNELFENHQRELRLKEAAHQKELAVNMKNIALLNQQLEHSRQHEEDLKNQHNSILVEIKKAYSNSLDREKQRADELDKKLKLQEQEIAELKTQKKQLLEKLTSASSNLQ